MAIFLRDQIEEGRGEAQLGDEPALKIDGLNGSVTEKTGLKGVVSDVDFFSFS